MVFDPTYPSIDNDYFPRYDWEKHYVEVKEVIPTNAPSPRGKVLTLLDMLMWTLQKIKLSGALEQVL